MGLVDLPANRRTSVRAPSVGVKHSNSIKKHLGSLKDDVPYFEGLPAIDYEDKNNSNTWGNIFKGKEIVYIIRE